MSYFTLDPSEQKAEAERTLRMAGTILEHATKTYEEDHSRVNRIALLAAERLVMVKESLCQYEEWTR